MTTADLIARARKDGHDMALDGNMLYLDLAAALEAMQAELRATEQMHRSWHDRALKAEPYMNQATNADSEIAHWKARAKKAEAVNGRLFPRARMMENIEELLGIIHWSDCALHNAPAYPPQPCDCGAMQKIVSAALEGTAP